MTGSFSHRKDLSGQKKKQVEFNAIILQSLLYFQRRGQPYVQEDRTNGGYSSMSHGWYMSDMDDTFRDVRFFDRPDRTGSGYGFYSSSGLDRYHGHHCYHPYKRSERG